MKEISLQLILETAGFKYEETTALMHITGFFHDKVDYPLSSSLESLADANISKFEIKEGFGNDNIHLADLINKLSNYMKDWINQKSISEHDLFNCVDGTSLRSAQVMSALHDGTKCLFTLREKFKGNLDKFISEINDQRFTQRH